MFDAIGSPSRASVSGKGFRADGEKYFIKGLTYGPFAPNGGGENFASPEQTAQDFARIHDAGVNLLRLYHVPPAWFLTLAVEYKLRLLIDIPWNQQVCFLDDPQAMEEAFNAVRGAVRACGGHPAVFGFSVVNEIPADIVRWSGAAAVSDFIDELVMAAKGEDPGCLCTFANFPTTEYLRPKAIDFWCFNVYLRQTRPFENYLERLQMIADGKPLVLGEFGADSVREGEESQAQTVGLQIEKAFRAGLAGTILYSYTDEWYKDGRDVLDWGFGLTDRHRQPKPSWNVMREMYRQAPYFPLARVPFVSVVVACYNGAGTLPNCLESLQKLRYPDYEIIVVDDGSVDGSAAIAAQFKSVRLIRHQTNLGLSEARNTGIEAARGEILAFTDADCRVDEDWLFYVAGSLLNGQFVGMGGPNLLPPDDSWVAAAVMASPGGPAHVMETDIVAEHIPGCNMAFYKWALEEIGGFDPVFRQAGDDVDLCWRLQERGYKIGFSAAGFVWHYRRSTVKAYLRQQYGYGEAEALLVRKHPERFSWFGGSVWHGRIYSQANFGLLFHAPRIYHGPFGSGLFQSLYAAQPDLTAMFFTSLEYTTLVALPLCVLATVFHFLAAPAVIALLIPAAVCTAAAAQAGLPREKRRFWSRPLVAMLFGLQPLVRGWARYHGRLSFHAKPLSAHETLDSMNLRGQGGDFNEVAYWTDNHTPREKFLHVLLEQLERSNWEFRPDAGWNRFDVKIRGSRWSRLHLMTVSEAQGNGKYLIRCRLNVAWTFLSRILLYLFLGGLVLLLGLWGTQPLWHWLIFVSVAGPVGWLWQQNRNLQRVFSVFLDDVAKPLNMVRAKPMDEEARKQAS
jgi:glycosyltransferase involved in cell wall biosynthesis